MRIVLATVALVLLAGCAGGAVDAKFIASAKAAPMRLQSDMGADGTLKSYSGNLEIEMKMTADGRTMTMPMEMDMNQEFYSGGSFHMEMSMSGSMMGESMSMTMNMVCTPDRIKMWMTGSPDGEDMNVDVENHSGSCDASEELYESLGGDFADAMQFNMFSEFTTLKYKDARMEGGKAWAVYEIDNDDLKDLAGMGSFGANFEMTFEIRATLDGDRIDRMELDGSMKASASGGGQDFNLDATFDGAMNLEYGTRGTMPAALLK